MKKTNNPLTLKERIAIENNLKKGLSIRKTATIIGRDKKTICREVGAFNGTLNYSAKKAHKAAEERKFTASRKRDKRLSFFDRKEIELMLTNGSKYREIAKEITRTISTIREEVERNGGIDRYNHIEAHEKALKRIEDGKMGLAQYSSKRIDGPYEGFSFSLPVEYKYKLAILAEKKGEENTIAHHIREAIREYLEKMPPDGLEPTTRGL